MFKECFRSQKHSLVRLVRFSFQITFSYLVIKVFPYISFEHNPCSFTIIISLINIPFVFEHNPWLVIGQTLRQEIEKGHVNLYPYDTS